MAQMWHKIEPKKLPTTIVIILWTIDYGLLQISNKNREIIALSDVNPATKLMSITELSDYESDGISKNIKHTYSKYD